MRNAIKVILVGFVALCRCACGGKKEALNEKDITEKLNEQDFMVSDFTSQMEDDSMKSVLIANNGNYQIEYYEFESEKRAKKAFNDNVDMFETINDKKGTTKSDETYDKYIQELSDTYNSLTRVGKTLIYASVNIEYKKDLNNLLKDLGY